MNAHSAPFPQRVATEFSFDWRWPVAVAIVASQLLFAGWLVAKPSGDDVLLWFDDISVAVAPFLAGVLSLFVVHRYWCSQTGTAWGFIALGLFFFAFGDAAWAIQEIALDIEVPFPSVSDIGYLGAYPAVFVGLLLMPLAPVAGMRRVKFTLDVLIALAAIAVLSWNFIITPLLEKGSGSALADAIGLAYPFADLGIVLAVLVLVARGGLGSSINCPLFLGAAFAVTALSDSLYLYLAQVATTLPAATSTSAGSRATTW